MLTKVTPTVTTDLDLCDYDEQDHRRTDLIQRTLTYSNAHNDLHSIFSTGWPNKNGTVFLVRLNFIKY